MFDCNFYDLDKKKVVRSRYIAFMKDHTIQDIEKSEMNLVPQVIDDLIDSDLVPGTHISTQVDKEYQEANVSDNAHIAEQVETDDIVLRQMISFLNQRLYQMLYKIFHFGDLSEIDDIPQNILQMSMYY